MITDQEEVIHCYGKEVLREEEHPWLEEWHTVLAVGRPVGVAQTSLQPQFLFRNNTAD